ncbi:TetR/AcrR family transcriptional regulator [Streptomyces sp. NBC_00075]|uniref:TetR/AcrR family transcriptional regulator n=1 Tax=Streptomyces sp. NBC_00075 TaxID=2975641 RepID=UPI00324ABEF3
MREGKMSKTRDAGETGDTVEERRGRPRSTATHQAILKATRDLLIEGGYARLTMDRVASRAGVGKQTVYRRWPSKAPMVGEAVIQGYLSTTTDGTASPLDTGDIDHDLRTWLHITATAMADPEYGALVRALTVASAENPADAESLYRQLAGPGQKALVHRLQTAVQSGQIRPDADLEAVADAFMGTLLHQILLGGSGVSGRRVEGLLDVVMAGLRREGS